jgi:hypothetical protein
MFVPQHVKHGLKERDGRNLTSLGYQTVVTTKLMEPQLGGVALD